MDRNRLLLLGGAIAAAVVAVVVVIVVAGGGSSSTSSTPITTTQTGTSTTGTEATDTFVGVPQKGDTLGKASAPTTLYVFEDPQCPYCRQWNVDTLPTVVDRYVRAGKLKVVYRGMEVIDDNSLVGLSAAYAAGRQNKLWQMVEALYERQGQEGSGWITQAVVRSAAEEIGADAEKILADMKSKAVTDELGASIKEAQNLGVSATPTFGYQKQLGTIQPLRITGLEPSDFTTALDAVVQ